MNKRVFFFLFEILEEVIICWKCYILIFFSLPFMPLTFIFSHLRYVKSRSDQQLRDPRDENATSACKPEDQINGMPIVPCGLIAWSLFNDTYSFSRNNQDLSVNKRGISWKSDRDHKFGKNVFPKNFGNRTLKGGATLVETVPVSFLPCS